MGFIEEKGIKAILFDIDGTLYDKKFMNLYLFKCALLNPFFSISYSKMRKAIRSLDKLDVKPVMRLSEFRRKEAGVIKPGFDEAWFAKYLKKYDKMNTHWINSYRAVPFDNMQNTLKRAKEEGLLLGALSDFPLGRKLDILGVAPFVDYKASAEDYGYLKPNPVPFCAMLRALDLKSDEAIYLGDSYSKDVVGAKNVGMYTALITHKGGDFPKADLVVKNWNELYNELF